MNIIREFSLYLIKFYQKFITLFSYGSCRYYPTCSEYSKQQFQQNKFYFAFYNSIKRVLSCNQLFLGGIDYPIIIKTKWKLISINKITTKKIKIKWWFVPVLFTNGEIKANHFYLIKDFSKTKILINNNKG